MLELKLRAAALESATVLVTEAPQTITPYVGALPLSEGSKYALVNVNTASGLTQTFPCQQAHQATTIRRREKLSTKYYVWVPLSNR